MSAYQSSSRASAYQSVAAHGGVAAANPHQLVAMLYDGAIERIQSARGKMLTGASQQSAQLIQRASDIVEELRMALRPELGGEMARNMADLYEYCGHRLLVASLRQKPEILDEVAGLLRELRTGWAAIAPSAQMLRTGT